MKNVRSFFPKTIDLSKRKGNAAESEPDEGANTTPTSRTARLVILALAMVISFADAQARAPIGRFSFSVLAVEESVATFYDLWKSKSN